MSRVVHAILAAHLGFIPEAREQLERAMADAGGSPFAETVQLVRERLRSCVPSL